MSTNALNFALTESLGGPERLLVFYDFSGLSGRTIGNADAGGATYDSLIENCDPSSDTGLFSGIILSSTNATVAGAKEFTTGSFLADDKGNLQQSNIKVSTGKLPYSGMAVLFDFEFNGGLSDCVLFGSLEKTSQTVNGEVILGAKGYNFGITERGKPFYQGFDKRGDFIYTADSVELSRRNIIGFSVGRNVLSMVRVDPLNNVVENEDFNVDTSFIADNDDFFLGGSSNYFRAVNEETILSPVSLNSFCVLSGYVPPDAMFSISSGLIGDYIPDTTTNIFKQKLTGYNQTVTYETGITGYDYERTGSINITTGRDMLTGSYFGQTNVNTGEGDRYFEYYTYEESGVQTFYKQEVGYLDPASGYQYLPTGEGAFDTLGLQNVDGAVKEYITQEGISGAGNIIVQLYGSRMMTGILSEVSGVIQEPVFETILEREDVTSSGIQMGSSSELFKKDFIFFMGDRL